MDSGNGFWTLVNTWTLLVSMPEVLSNLLVGAFIPRNLPSSGQNHVFPKTGFVFFVPSPKKKTLAPAPHQNHRKTPAKRLRLDVGDVALARQATEEAQGRLGGELDLHNAGITWQQLQGTVGRHEKFRRFFEVLIV